MAPFTGQAEASIDAKLRLAIPAKYRSLVDRSKPATSEKSQADKTDPPAEPAAPTAWYAVPWPEGGMLRLYPEDRFEALAANRVATLTPDESTDEIETTLFGLAERLEPDSAGRIRLVKHQLELIDLPTSVVVVGVNDHLQVRDREAWERGRRDRFRRLGSLAGKSPAAATPAPPTGGASAS